MPRVFSYGTLQERAVQIETFGRELIIHDDSLAGFRLTKVAITNPALAAKMNMTHTNNALATGDPGDSVDGATVELTAAELNAADRYEAPADYRRIRCTLVSGRDAWVYVHEGSIDDD